jgi:IMP dehydrogenase
MAPEGESTFVWVKGHVKDVVQELTGGVRSGMSYLNATSILEIRDKARFIEMSPAGVHESRAHGVSIN